MSDDGAKVATSVGYSGVSITSTTPYYQDSHVSIDDYNRRKRNEGNTLSSVNSDGKIDMTHNNIHIQPVSNGFVVTMCTIEDGIKSYCFSDFEGVTKFINGLSLMDLDSELVAENV